MRVRAQCALIGLLGLATALSLTAPVGAQTRYTMQTTLFTNGVSGPGEQNSITTNGAVYMTTFGLTSRAKTEAREFDLNLSGLSTDDGRINPEALSLTNLQLRMADARRVISLGDTFEPFSHYTLNSALKGLSWRTGTPGRPEITFVYGYSYPNWNSFANDSTNKAVTRIGYGARVKKDLSPMWTVGFNAMKSTDDDRVLPTDPLYDIDLYGVDWEYRPFSDLTLRGELCYGNTQTDPGSGEATTSSTGLAHRFVFDGNTGKTRILMEYERVAPGFATVLGSAISDRERVKLKWRQKNSRTVTMNYGVVWYQDNLAGQKDYTTSHLRPEIGITVRNPLGKSGASADITYRLDRRFGGGKSTTNGFWMTGYRAPLGDVDCDANAGYTSYETRDPLLVPTEVKEYVYGATFSTSTSRGNSVLRPYVKMGGWVSEDERSNLRKRVREFSVGCGLNVPAGRLSADVKLGWNKLKPAVARQTGAGGPSGVKDNSAKMFGVVTVYYTPPFLAKSNQQIFLKAYLNDYNYVVDQEDFRENSVAFGLTRQY